MAQKKTIVIEAKDNTKQAFKKVQKNLKATDQAVNKTKRSMDGLKAGIKGAIGALTIGAFVTATKSTLDLADALGKTSARLGLTTEGLQTLRFAATQSGMSTEMLEMSMQRFTRRMAEANNGTGVLKDTFKQLGISITGPNGKLKNAESILGDVADKMASIPEQGKRVELAFKMFDSEGVKMVNMLQGGSKAFGDLRQSLIDTGAIMGDDFIKDAESANDALDKLGTQFRVAFANAISGLAPAINATASALGDFITVAKEYPILTALAGAITAVGLSLALLGGPVTAVISGISLLMTAGIALNNHFKTQAELTDVAGLSLGKLKDHYKNVSQELKDVNKELAEGETWWHKFGFGSVKGLEDQKKELEKVKKELEDQLSVKEKIVKVKKEETVVDKQAYDLGQETIRQQLQLSPMLIEDAKKRAQEKIKLSQDEVAQTIVNIKSQKEAYAKWQAEKRSMGDAGMERLREEYFQQKELVDEAYMGEIEMKEKHAEQMLIVDKAYDKAVRQLNMERSAVIAGQASALAQELNKQGVMGFDAMKAFAIAEATINAFVAASKAWAQGGAFGAISAGLTLAMAMVQVDNIRKSQPPKREAGGPVSRGKSFMVGERGPELFTPNQSGGITPNNQISGGVTNINFNIKANDARGFDALLQARRGMIVSMINRSLNERGKRAII